MARKLSISCKDSPNRGYFEIGGENLGEKKIGDYKEGVDIGRELTRLQRADIRSEAELRMKQMNKWPTDLPGWRDCMLEYYDAMATLGIQLTRGVALSLGIDKHFFDDKLDQHMASLRVLHYPPQGVAADDEHLGAGPHTDYGVLTILAQDHSGLQVQNRQRQWIEVPTIPDTFVINLGDMMQRWTNDVYRSTPHRVINTKPLHRYSIPYFFEPDFKALVEVIPTCVSTERPAKYPPITFGQHLTNMYDKTYKKYTEPNVL